MDYKLPNDLKYASTHEWAKIEGDVATIGISDYAQHQLGDIVFVELPEIGTVFEKGSIICEIESVKAVGELICPLSGEIIEANEHILDQPELVNSSPYDEGWMVKVKFSDSSESNELLSAEAYQELIEKEKN